MSRFLLFLTVSVVVISVWACSHLAFIAVFGHFFQDADGLYLRVTAVTYALQSATAVMLAINFLWSISGVFDKAHRARWTEIAVNAAIPLSFLFSFFTLGVFRNRYTWLDKLLFENDIYGYTSPEPAANSFVMTLIMWGIMWVIARNRLVNYKRRHFLLACLPSVGVGLAVYHFATF